ncbi:MAG: class I SAM-dependent methyltransferase [Hasllibacter sp.]
MSSSKALIVPEDASFCTQPASAKNAVRLADGGWITDFSSEGLEGTGTARLVPDPRFNFVRRHLGSFEGKRILELGSLEGAHTLQYTREGASVTGVEANEAHFLKSLVLLNAAGVRDAQMLLGDFEGYLSSTEDRFDIVSALGVLYHMTNPVNIVRLCSRVASSMVIWTVVYHEEGIPDGHRRLISGEIEQTAGDFTYRGMKHHYRSLDAKKARKTDNFSGGLENFATWITWPVLKSALEHFGFT